MTLRPPECVNLAGTDTADRDCLSHTRLGVFLSCQEKFRWKYVERLEPAVKSAPLTMGAAFAHATETGDPQAGYDMLVEERDALAIEYGGNPWIVVPTDQDAQLQATIVLAASTAYLERFGTRARREVEYRQRIRNPITGYPSRSFDVMARVDGIDGDVLIEDKLVSKVEAATERTLLLDKQRQNESFDAYCERIIDDYATRPEFYIFEWVLFRDSDDFLRLEHELWAWCEQIRAASRAGVFPRNSAACLDYGGCELLPLCTRRVGAINEFRVRETRDPTKVIETTEGKAA
jgi:hypothetical protein